MASVNVSPEFRLRRLLFQFLSVWLAICASALILFQYTPLVHAAEVTLAWDPNGDPDLAGYRIYYGFSTRNYVSDVDIGNNTSCTLSNLEAGRVYYLAATAYDTKGDESDFSNEVIFQTPSPCGFSISPISQSFGASEGSGTVSVTTQSGCTWTAVSNASWLIITSNGNGTGSGNLNYSVLANPNPSSRTGTMTIAGRTFTATQASIQANTSLTVNSAAGTYGGTVNLSASLTSGGSSVSGKSVSFTLNGSSAGTATTATNGVATLNNVGLAGIGAGTYSTGVGVSFAGDTNYTGSSGSNSLTVNRANQMITVTTHAPSSAAYNTSFNVAAATDSRLAVAITTSGSCSGSGSGSATITMTSGTGTCNVQYDQAGNSNYNGALRITEYTTATKAAATVTLGSLSQSYDRAPKAVTAATNPSGLAVTFTYNGLPTAPTVAGSYTVVGTVSHSNYQGSATGTLNIAQVTLTVTGITASNKIYDGTTRATLNINSATLAGVISGDNVTLNTASATGTFANQNVGTWTVYVSGLTLNGTAAGNYILTQPTLTASITPSTGPTQLTLDSAASGTTSGNVATSLSYAHTIGNGSNRLLVVAISTHSSSTPTNIKYRGTSLTALPGSPFAGNGNTHVYFYYLLNPPIGTANITYNITGVSVAGSVSVTGANQTMPFGTAASATGTTSGCWASYYKVAVSTGSNDLVVDALAVTVGTGTSSTLVASGQTRLWNIRQGSGDAKVRGCGSAKAGGAGSTTMSWRLWAGGGDCNPNWLIVAVPIKPSTSP
jgi:hypothetical protein